MAERYFLVERFENGLEYRSIGSHRSAISAFHQRINIIPVRENPSVSPLLSEIFNKRPPQALYALYLGY